MFYGSSYRYFYLTVIDISKTFLKRQNSKRDLLTGTFVKFD